ncbi:MAG: hypothetical protein H8D23_12035 [Candidatus Brocadiales bacterium]|nr:hypothetical protein [Candidatus Brocadiales bacterium]
MKYYAAGATIGGATGFAATAGNDRIPTSDKVLATAGGAALGAGAVGYGKAVNKAHKANQKTWQKSWDDFSDDFGKKFRDKAKAGARSAGIKDSTSFFGIDVKATTHKKQVKKKYYKWANQTHPDKFQTASEAVRKQKEAEFKIGGQHYSNIKGSTWFEKLSYLHMKYMTKQAEEGDSTYPLTRAYNSGMSWTYYNIPRAINARAMQGRVNVGSPGLTEKERLIMSNMDPNSEDKTYPISRAITNPVTSSIGLGAMGAVLGGANAGVAGAVVGAGVGAGLGYGATYFDRAMTARGYVGRARAGREGILPSDRRVLRQNRDKV